MCTSVPLKDKGCDTKIVVVTGKIKIKLKGKPKI